MRQRRLHRESQAGRWHRRPVIASGRPSPPGRLVCSSPLLLRCIPLVPVVNDHRGTRMVRAAGAKSQESHGVSSGRIRGRPLDDVQLRAIPTGPRAGPQTRPTGGPADTQVACRARAACKPARSRRHQGRAFHDRVAGNRCHGCGAGHLYPGDPRERSGTQLATRASSRRCIVVATGSWPARRTMRRAGPTEGMPRPSSTPLVGRGDEVAVLTDAFDRARRGTRQICLISGEPGVGKSALPGRSARASLRDQDHVAVGVGATASSSTAAASRTSRSSTPSCVLCRGPGGRGDRSRRSNGTRRCGSRSSRASSRRATRPHSSGGLSGRFAIGCCGS